MNNETKLVLAVLTLLSGLSFGFCVGIAVEESYWQKQLVDRGYAQHNSKTGRWEWVKEATAP